MARFGATHRRPLPCSAHRACALAVFSLEFASTDHVYHYRTIKHRY